MNDPSRKEFESTEEARIAAILRSGAIDAPPDEQLDRITRMTARVFGVPIAMATIIDADYIWIKSSVGFEPTCLEREDGLCELVIKTGSVVQLNDARKHPVAKLHPLVDNGEGIVFYAGAPIRNSEGHILGTLCIADLKERSFSEYDRKTLQDFADWVVDLIERRRAERERGEDRLRFQALSNNPQLEMIEVDDTGVIVDSSHTVLKESGFDQSEIVGQPLLKFIHPDSQQEMIAALNSVINGDSIEIFTDIIYKDGSTHTFEVSSCPIQIESGATHAMSILWDVTEQLLIEAKVSIAERRYRKLFETSRDAMAFLTVADGKIMEVNGAFCELTGYSKETLEQMLYSDLRSADVDPEQLQEDLVQLETTGISPEREREMRCRDGSVVPVSVCAWLLTDDRNEPLAILSRTRNITQQKQLERAQAQQQDHLETQVAQRTQELEETLTRLRRAERLASVGTLASGLAHQINNPIGSILNSAEYALLCEEDQDADSVWKEALLESVAQARRCGRIVRSMLQYSRGARTERWAEDFGDVLQRALNATQSYAKSNHATIKVTEDGRPTPVLVNPIEMEQVLVNIINNAIESNASGANISIQLQAREEQVCIAVTDDGRGIPREHTSRVLDPFYTTRQQEGGTGLGLSVAAGIAVEFGGTLSVASEPAAGTTVTIIMPLAISTTTQDARL
ncbi:MAG: PAS domain S-box protein [Myxococcales bacterium]|nr:PAS domain S-box protein [Myxococcales bacterium]